MHKTLRVILISALIAVFAVNSALANPFHDVPEDHWAYDSISYLAEKGIIEGYPDGTYGGSRSFTRYEMAMVFARILASLEAEVQSMVEKEVSLQTEDMVQQIDKAMDDAAKALATALQTQLAADRAMSMASQAIKAANAALAAVAEIEGLDLVESPGADALKAQIEEVRLLAEQALDAISGMEGIVDGESVNDRIENGIEIAIFAVELAQKAQSAASSAVELAGDSAGQAFAAKKAADEAMSAAQAALDAIDALKFLGEDGVISVTAEPSEVAKVITAERILQQIQDLNGRVDEIAAAVASLSSNSVDSLEAIQIARNVVSREIGALRNKEITDTKDFIRSEASRLEKEINSLAKEFEYELFLLGLKVDKLNQMFGDMTKKVKALETDIDDIRAEMARVRVSGSNTSTVKYGVVEGTGTPKVDPRNSNSSNLYVAPPSFVDLLELRLDANLAEGIDAKVGVDASLNHRFATMGNPDPADPMLNNLRAFAEVAIDGPINLVRLGAMDSSGVAGLFNKYTLFANAYGNNQSGALINANIGQGSYAAFVSTEPSNRYSLGFASEFKPNPDMDVTANLVRTFDAGQRTVLSLDAASVHEDLNLAFFVARDIEEKATVIQTNGSLNVEDVLFQAEYAYMDAIWGSDDRVPFAEKQKTAENTSYTNPIQADQNRISAKVEVPLFGFNIYGQIGRYATNMSAGLYDRTNEYGIIGSDLLGGYMDIKASKEKGFNQDLQARDRISVQTDIDLGVDVGIAYHKQVSEQVGPTEEIQNHYMFTVANSLNVGELPVNYAVSYGASQSANKSHVKYEVGLSDYAIMPSLLINAKYAVTNNVLTKGDWLPNAHWTDEGLVERSFGASWDLNEKMTLSGNYAVADSNINGVKVTRNAGFEYDMDAFGGDLTVGYGFQLVTIGGNVDGAPRNSISASFVKSLNGFVMKADGRYVTGGTADEAGNDNDTIGSIELSYPVFSDAVFNLEGKYVKSEGDKPGRDEYKGHSLSAGLKVTF